MSRLLRALGFSLKANVKRLSGPRHPDREEQFGQIGKKMQRCRRQGVPILSVDTKKKELIANFRNAGKTWPDQEIAVSDHDFPSQATGKGIPYGIYDVVRNQGLVVVGTSSETGAFGVDSLATWYRRQRRRQWAEADRLLLLCDNGGCNGSRNRSWKYELQKFSDRFGVAVEVAHYPPRASKWNPIEHRLFSQISKNWAGQPLTSYETVLNYIGTTTTDTGLRVKAVLNPKTYRTKVVISDGQMDQINIRMGRVLPQWNYTIRPPRTLSQLILRGRLARYSVVPFLTDRLAAVMQLINRAPVVS
ncbi:MAG: ISAzo13 family transposase [Dehalococcoidia bacterium]